MKLYSRIMVCMLSTVMVVACQSTGDRKPGAEKTEEAEQADRFISVEGPRFMKGEKPYYFVGANFWYGAYLGATPSGQSRLVRELDLLAKTGVTNLRVLAASEKTDIDMALEPVIHEAPGQYNEALLQGLDFLLVEMGKRDMHAVLFLNNFWPWSGGMSQYVAWFTGDPVVDPDTTGNWNAFMQNSAGFYRIDEAQRWYREFIEHIVTRTNTITGQRYIDDPTIMSWQLANEPRPGSDEEGRPFFPQFKQWIIDTAQYIKTLDPNHLVSTGNEGAMGTLRDIELYLDSHAAPEIDYLTFHMWPKNWSWLDVTDPEGTYESALTTARAYMLQHIQVAHRLGKPTVLEEFGVERDNADYRPESTTRQRDRFFREIFGLMETQARLGFPIAGSNFWAWGGAGRSQHPDMIWKAGDLFTGDPPQEHQGLNSVFDIDKSTIQVIANHAKAMKELAK